MGGDEGISPPISGVKNTPDSSVATISQDYNAPPQRGYRQPPANQQYTPSRSAQPTAQPATPSASTEV